MNEEITDVKPPMGFPHITDLAGSEATILQVANSQGDILGYATLNDIDAYIEQKVTETVHSFSQKQIFQDVTINGTFDGNNVVNQSKLNGALTNYVSFRKLKLSNDIQGDILEIDNKQLKIVTYIGLIRSQVSLGEVVALDVKTPVFILTDDVLVYGYLAGNANGRVLVRNINTPHIQLDYGECNFVITYSYR